MASYTFDSAVTCCQHVAHNNTILVGLESHRHYVILALFDQQQPKGQPVLTTDAGPKHDTESLWKVV